MLTAAERAHFDEKGWAGPWRLLDRASAHHLAALAARTAHRFRDPSGYRSQPVENLFATTPWFKSLHAHLPEFFDLAAMPSLAGRVIDILGPDVLAWGVAVLAKRPGGTHPWHVDVEHFAWHGVSAFVGLANTGPDATLTLMEGSHHISGWPADLSADDDVERRAQAHWPTCRRVKIAINDGEFFLFHGRLWHGSINRTQHVRHAAILQYCQPDQAVAIPLNFEPPVRWHSHRPPCTQVSGTAAGPNLVVARPLLG